MYNFSVRLKFGLNKYWRYLLSCILKIFYLLILYPTTLVMRAVLNYLGCMQSTEGLDRFGTTFLVDLSLSVCLSILFSCVQPRSCNFRDLLKKFAASIRFVIRTNFIENGSHRTTFSITCHIKQCGTVGKY